MPLHDTFLAIRVNRPTDMVVVALQTEGDGAIWTAVVPAWDERATSADAIGLALSLGGEAQWGMTATLCARVRWQ